MSKFLSIIRVCIFFLSVSISSGQNISGQQENFFVVKGLVIESDSRKPIQNVNVEITGSAYTTTDFSGRFEIKARKGDELIVRSKDFETVYYTIYNNESITIKVEELDENVENLNLKNQSYELLLDSAKFYLKKDFKKSIEFVTQAMDKSNSSQKNAEAFEMLGDINVYWKQLDLAANNYLVSLQNLENNQVRLKLAEAYKENKNYQESLDVYDRINRRSLSTSQLINLYSNTGDIYLLTNKYDSAKKAYEDGLTIAKSNNLTLKVTDLNSKLAEVYNASGAREKAEVQFEKSLILANKENKKRALEEKVKVADFQNKINNYDSEIELRKEALNDLEIIEDEEEISNESAMTSQKQNYKIGNAYALKRDFNNAIPYLEESIKEASKKEDLIVEKDATRKLSEVYRDAGEFNKALLAYQNYVELVDKLYIKKEQEISQSARISKEIINKQNRILSLENDRELSESKYQLSIQKANNQKVLIYSLGFGLVLVLTIAVVMFKYIRQQRLANNLLALKSLRSQMNPHFIFNALNSVNSFISSQDERAANKYLTDFSLLMRAVLEYSEKDFIPLENEIELIALYTKLEHFRFQDKFDYSITVDDAIDVSQFVIPPMLLQPYVENAVWHGLRYKKEMGRLDIRFTKKTDDEIVIIIADDGIGREQSKQLKTKNQQKQSSKGMGNIQKRVAILNSMYKDKVDVSITNLKDEVDTGTKVVVTLKKD